MALANTLRLSFYSAAIEVFVFEIAAPVYGYADRPGSAFSSIINHSHQENMLSSTFCIDAIECGYPYQAYGRIFTTSWEKSTVSSHFYLRIRNGVAQLYLCNRDIREVGPANWPLPIWFKRILLPRVYAVLQTECSQTDFTNTEVTVLVNSFLNPVLSAPQPVH